VTDAITPDQVLRYLGDVDYPAGKEVLVVAAEQAGAPDAVIRSLRALPPVVTATVRRWCGRCP
jgi:hypothetical protein